MVPTDVTTTQDTTGGMGDKAPYYEDSQFEASNTDTSGTPGESVDADYDPELFPDAAGTRDTEGVTGGEHSDHEDDWDVQAGNISGTLSTLEPGSPTNHADPDYRAPNDFVGAMTGAGSADTTHTDLPISDGSDPDETLQYQSGTRDTVNPTVTLQTTTENLPGTPGGAPTVVALPRAVKVTVGAVSDPAGAAVRGYRVEGSTGGVDFIPRDASGGPAARTVLVTNLVPSQVYKFRYQAVNDNGSGPWSAYSADVTPLNPDEPGPGLATGLTEDNKVNPIYSPDGTVKPGTGGTSGPVATLTLAATLVVGALKVDYTAPTWGAAVVTYELALKDDTGAVVATHDVAAPTLTYTFTGLDIGPYTVTCTPVNAKGDGIAKTSSAATPLATQPTITTIDPDTGAAAGGTAVTITGTNFVEDGLGVTFDGVSATAVAFVSATEVTCDTPAHAAGAVDVEVVTYDGAGSVTEVDGFTYT